MGYVFFSCVRSHTTQSKIKTEMFITRFYCRYPAENIYNIDTQFLWGENLLISPVLEQVHEMLFSSVPVCNRRSVLPFCHILNEAENIYFG